MNTNCDMIRDLLPLVEDGTASAATAAFVKEHLQNCEACRRYRKQMQDSEKAAREAAAKTLSSRTMTEENRMASPAALPNDDRISRGYAALARRYKRRRTFCMVATAAVITVCAVSALQTILKDHRNGE